jgi:hypothetical protein
MASKSSDKEAIITIGRWEPPHRGHEVLVRDTIQMARDVKGKPFIWVSPIQERTRNDPLSITERIYYLNRMYPKRIYGDLTFLTDNPGLSLRPVYERELDSGPSLLTRSKPGNTLPDNWGSMSICQKYKYKNLVSDRLLDSRVKIVRDRAAKASPGSKKLPSKQCLNWLRKRGFMKVTILVGSDRVEAFRKYNEELGKKLFKNFKIEQSGYDRGETGMQKLERSISDDSEEELAELSMFMDRLSLSLSPQDKKGRAEEYSGTRTREAAYNGNARKFMEAVMIHNSDMTFLDSFCMMNDIRRGAGMAAIPIAKWEGAMLTPEHYRVLRKDIRSIGTWSDSFNDDEDFGMKTFAITGPESRRRRRKKRRGGRKTKRKRKRKKKKTLRRKGKRKTRKKRQRGGNTANCEGIEINWSNLANKQLGTILEVKVPDEWVMEDGAYKLLEYNIEDLDAAEMGQSGIMGIGLKFVSSGINIFIPKYDIDNGTVKLCEPSVENDTAPAGGRRKKRKTRKN